MASSNNYMMKNKRKIRQSHLLPFMSRRAAIVLPAVIHLCHKRPPLEVHAQENINNNYCQINVTNNYDRDFQLNECVPHKTIAILRLLAQWVSAV